MTEWHFDYAGIESSSNKHRVFLYSSVPNPDEQIEQIPAEPGN